jgi:hypothetical protein
MHHTATGDAAHHQQHHLSPSQTQRLRSHTANIQHLGRQRSRKLGPPQASRPLTLPHEFDRPRIARLLPGRGGVVLLYLFHAGLAAGLAEWAQLLLGPEVPVGRTGLHPGEHV